MKWYKVGAMRPIHYPTREDDRSLMPYLPHLYLLRPGGRQKTRKGEIDEDPTPYMGLVFLVSLEDGSIVVIKNPVSFIMMEAGFFCVNFKRMHFGRRVLLVCTKFEQCLAFNSYSHLRRYQTQRRSRKMTVDMLAGRGHTIAHR